jgi:prepilin-type processing-associated H-X9-DG protein
MKLAEKGIVDEQLQSKGFLFIITRLANMRKAVRQVLNSFHGGRFNILFYDNIYDEKMIQSHATTFKDAGIIGEVKPLLRSVAQIYKKVELGS